MRIKKNFGSVLLQSCKVDFLYNERFWDVNFSFWTAIIHPPVFCVHSSCHISNTDIFFKTSMLWNCAVSKSKGIENILIRILYVTKFMIIYNSLFLKDCINIWQPCTSGFWIQWMIAWLLVVLLVDLHITLPSAAKMD